MKFLRMNFLRKILSSYTFQFSVASITILSVVVMFVMFIVYGFFSYSFFHQVHSTLSRELEVVEETYHQSGVPGVARFVQERHDSYQVDRFAYILVDTNLNKLAGDLETWPSFREYGDGWLSFELDILQSDGEALDHAFVARSIQLPEGHQLLVARDFDVIQQYISLVTGILVRVFIVTISMGAVGSFFISWGLQRRLDMVNQNIQTIMAGDLSERLKVIDSPSEIERLVENLNQMLDKIEYLMDGVKRVSDNIAHDLRTPLTRLRNHLTGFARKCSEEDRQSVNELIEEVDDMLATFNALLRISRIEAGESVAEKSIMPLELLVRDVIELYEPLASDKDVDVSAHLAKGAYIKGDRNLLFQAIANIVDNAIKYTPEKGKVHITLRTLVSFDNDNTGEQKESIELVVADSGCGIESTNREKVFRRFYREEASRGKQPGNGLGLSLVAAVMDKHDVKIKLEDNYPGLRISLVFAAANPEDEKIKGLLTNQSSSINISRDVSISRAS